MSRCELGSGGTRCERGPGRVNYKPNGRQRFSGAAWPGATCLSFEARRLDLVLLYASRWRNPGVRRISFPVAVSLNRLATDFFVFCIVFDF